MNPIIRIENQGQTVKSVLTDLLLKEGYSYRKAGQYLQVSPKTVKAWALELGITQVVPSQRYQLVPPTPESASESESESESDIGKGELLSADNSA